nr:response regulator [Magnetofaba australis]
MRFEVVDTGIGIAPDQADNIFSPFAQGDASTTRRYGGTGLGLAISCKLVEKMGGELGLESTPGEGSAFIFQVPMPPCAAPTASADDAHEQTTQPSDARSLRILIAEDSEDNILLLKAYLKRSAHRIIFARDGREAVYEFERAPFDLVLMDVQMPRMDGYDATRAMRAIERQRNEREIPIFALSAHASKEAHKNSHEAGCDGHLTKPIKKARLLELFDSVSAQLH